MGSVLRKVPSDKLAIPLVKFRNPLGNSEGLRFDRFIQNKRYDKKWSHSHAGGSRPGEKRTTPKNLSAHESEERGREESVGFRNAISAVIHT